jgi:hypothetical protein
MNVVLPALVPLEIVKVLPVGCCTTSAAGSIGAVLAGFRL